MREHVMALIERHLPGPFKPGGSNIITRCPFHKDGNERKPSFSISLDDGLFHCFTCHEAGTIRTLLEKLSVPRSSIDSELSVIQPHLDAQKRLFKAERDHTFIDRDPFKADYVLPESLLGVYALCPTPLVQDGFQENILREMEVGYDRENNRIMYPLRDMYGNLAGFSGGVTQWSKFQAPKYRVYQGRRPGANGRWVDGDYGKWFDERFRDYRCENHDFLWNFHRVMPRTVGMSGLGGTVYVVEGFKACLWMVQSGFPNTVALMGSYISDRQQKMLHRFGGTLVLCLDNDEAGRRATLNVGDLLWKPMYGRVRVMPYPEEDDATQPDDYESEFLRGMVGGSKTYLDYINSRRMGRSW